jgi:hypothetical protein
MQRLTLQMPLGVVFKRKGWPGQLMGQMAAIYSHWPVAVLSCSVTYLFYHAATWRLEAPYAVPAVGSCSTVAGPQPCTRWAPTLSGRRSPLVHGPAQCAPA